MSSSRPPKNSTPETVERQRQNVGKLVKAGLSADTVTAASKILVPQDPVAQRSLLLKTLFKEQDLIFLCAGRKLPAESKETPTGPTWLLSVPDIDEEEELLSYTFKKHGGFFRPNPIKPGGGTGKNKAIRDDDIAEFRFAVIEHDELPKEDQLALLCTLSLPITSIVDSGGKSLHALVPINAPSAEEYAHAVGELYRALGRLGFDQANKNPSRMTRLPGSWRELEGGQTSLQKLIYLNPNPDGAPIVNSL